MKKIEIKDTEQLISFLYLKDELIHIYDELRFAKDIDYKVFEKVKNRLKMLDEAIELYIQQSSDVFKIQCLENVYIEPQDSCELKTNVLGHHLQDAKIIFDGSIPSAGYLELSYEDKDYGTGIYVKNNMPRKALENWDICGYHPNNPTTTRYIAPGVYLIEKMTTVGIVCSKDQKLVKTINDNYYKR